MGVGLSVGPTIDAEAAGFADAGAVFVVVFAIGVFVVAVLDASCDVLLAA